VASVNVLAVTLALLSAATFAISTSVQHQAAEKAPASVQSVLALLGYLVRRPLWLVGQLLATCAFALHASALNAGPIAVVQPIVVSGIVWAVPARAAISRRMPALTELRAVLITATGLAVFLVASDPTVGTPAGLGTGTILLAVAGLLVAVVANVAASRVQNDARRKAFFLGVVGGVLFGLVAGFMKLALQELNDKGLSAMLTAWPTYALVLAGASGVLTNQRAYRTAGLSASMPALNIVNGLTSLLFGFTVFSEVPRHTPLFLVIEAGALGCMAVGLWMLIRFEEAHQQEAEDPSPGLPPVPLDMKDNGCNER
jgi:drug/metabolite transporter (DMT)-like permease